MNKLTNATLNVIMLGMITTLTKALINIIYPPLCLQCKKLLKTASGANLHICNECYTHIKRYTPPLCRGCGRSLKTIRHICSGRCAQCLNKEYFFDRAWSLYQYEGLLKNLIHDFKYKQKLHYATIFQRLIKEFFTTYNVCSECDSIIPIPLHPVKLREREFNQSHILARIVSDILGKPVHTDVLVRIRNTKPQVDLDEHARVSMIKGCFHVAHPQILEQQNILLIDDVFTTGATLSEASRVIRKFNPKTIEVLTLAS